jgi:hypothetical protein
MNNLFNKLLASDEDNNLTKLVPLLIFFVIWVVGAIAKAAQKGKKGEEEEATESQEKHEPSFDDLAKKIRERYGQAKEQAKKNMDMQQGVKTGQPPPARATQIRQPPPRRPMPEPTRRPVISARHSVQYEEGPTLRVVKELEKPAVNVPVALEKQILERVEPGLEKVEGITSDVPMVTTQGGPKEPHFLSELSAQFLSTDNLRKAILNYEILGPPLSMRE